LGAIPPNIVFIESWSTKLLVVEKPEEVEYLMKCPYCGYPETK
jgi:hypothetical protein